MGEAPLAGALESVLRVWAGMAARGEMSRQTFSKFTQLLGRFQAYATARGATELGQVTPQLASAFIDAQGRTLSAATLFPALSRS
ncbi:hypothetical protein QZH56_20985 [Streptomyces olivoreticuli]|uniref:hypothetical protein n=1 Tax=Streptomyces olivoreticuli TaxID=68246 RepID=UPI00265A1539|nr:hypothetical protein [Streptomyces olivoreticuli]WKK21337.1 hypothetical protein QZH56_20985 [Streptomyces olivoreticuli]